MKNIFTVIMFKKGGDVSPCRCCVECGDGSLDIYTYSSINDFVYKLAEINTKEHFNENEYDSQSVLINGVVLDEFDTSSIWDYCDADDRNELESQILELKNTVKELVVEKQKELIEKETADRLIKSQQKEQKEQAEKVAKQKQAEDAERSQYLNLKQKFEK